MDEKKNRKSPRLQGYDYSRNGAYFITVCTKNRQCVLSRIVGTGVPDCPRAHAMPVPTEYEETVNSNNTNMEKANSVVSQFISTFKRFCNKDFKENIWQGRYFDHIIRNRVDYEAHLRYIAENPLHWLYDELFSEQSLQHTGNTKDPTP